MTPAQAELTRVRTKIVKGWTRASFARNASGSTVAPEDPEAVCWCIAGAFYACKFTLNGVGWKALLQVNQVPVVFNDEECRSQADMLSLIDIAIASAS